MNSLVGADGSGCYVVDAPRPLRIQCQGPLFPLRPNRGTPQIHRNGRRNYLQRREIPVRLGRRQKRQAYRQRVLVVLEQQQQQRKKK